MLDQASVLVLCLGWGLIDYQHGMYSYHHHLVFTTLIEFIMKVFGKTFYFLIFFYSLKLFASLLKPNHVNLVKIILKQLNEKTCIKYLTSVMSSESLSSLSRIKTSWSFCNDMVVYLCFDSHADTTK